MVEDVGNGPIIGEHNEEIPVEDQDDFGYPTNLNDTLEDIVDVEIDNKRKRDSKRPRVGVKVTKWLDSILPAIENRSSTFKSKDKVGCSIEEVMQVVEGIPKIVNDDDLFMKAADILTERKNRDMFIVLKQPNPDVAYKQENMSSSNSNGDNANSLTDDSDDEFYDLISIGCVLNGTRKVPTFKETVSRWFGIILEAISRMAIDFRSPSDPKFKRVPKKIKDDNQYWSYFKDCIEAINGTHVPVVVPRERQVPYISRNGITTQISWLYVILMCFTFSWVGWEGAAHNARIFMEALIELSDIIFRISNEEAKQEGKKKSSIIDIFIAMMHN
ncbi:unnamed protein product [Prunus armeniaca]|uniref:Uncharacterized protein n=1 Tax=Prunus armeniaca TaxID=36596 RepID=A0A6J5V711_PRUAR|nr:unnamed protein product [Prunus armeniaca]